MRRILKRPREIIRLAERYVDTLTEPAPSAFRAWVKLGSVVRNLYADQAFDLACHILHRLPPADVGAVGGGTLAHLVECHGGALIDWLEKEARRDAKFLEALSSVCLATEEVNPFVLLRLRAATRNRIQVVPRVERDAAYRDMLNLGLTSYSSRRARMSMKRSQVRVFELLRGDEPPPRGIR